MSLWKKTTREEKLAWFATLSDGMLEEVWRSARDRNFPETSEENFICRGCRHWVTGIACEAPKSMGVETYKDCEAAVTTDPLAWLSRMKDPFIEEGREDHKAGIDRDECPYDEGTDGEAGWKTGWNEMEAIAAEEE